jgi:Ca2+-binding EF-hand superfamily protein
VILPSCAVAVADSRSRSAIGTMGKGKKAAPAAAAEDKGEGKEAEAAAAPAAPKKESAAVRLARLKLRQAFALLDKAGEGRVLQEDVGCVMRHLGQFPSEQQLQEEVLPTMQSDEPDAYVSLVKFEPRMVEILQEQRYAPDGQDVILAAFRALDEGKLGYIDADYLRSLMENMGTPMRGKELDAFLSAAKDPASGKVYYEDYALLYINQLDLNRNMWRKVKLGPETEDAPAAAAAEEKGAA